MPGITLHEIVPGRVYQRGQFVTFPVHQKLAMLERNRIDVVVNLWARPDMELHQKDGLIYIHWPIAGNVVPSPKWPIIDMLASYYDAGKNILIHCEAGVNRSVWLALLLRAVILEEEGAITLQRMAGAFRMNMRTALLDDVASFIPE